MAIWTNNLVKCQQSHRRKGSVPIEESLLEEKCNLAVLWPANNCLQVAILSLLLITIILIEVDR